MALVAEPLAHRARIRLFARVGPLVRRNMALQGEPFKKINASGSMQIYPAVSPGGPPGLASPHIEQAIFFGCCMDVDILSESGATATLRLLLPADLDIATAAVPGGAVRPGSDGLDCAGGIGDGRWHARRGRGLYMLGTAVHVDRIIASLDRS